MDNSDNSDNFGKLVQLIEFSCIMLNHYYVPYLSKKRGWREGVERRGKRE